MSNSVPLIKPENIINIKPTDFDEMALEIFRFQYGNNHVYRQYCDALHINVEEVRSITQIPFLPISFFKTHRVQTGHWEREELLFESSGTTGEVTSKHFIKEADVYRQSLLHGFSLQYGTPQQYTILALLPSYLERKNASLVYMARELMEASGRPGNGFYINEWKTLHDKLTSLVSGKQQVILLGVTFALLDFAEAYPGPLGDTIVMETGGMKGRRKEMTRTEVHEYLQRQWQLPAIHSEYGMTELLSQAYAHAKGIYTCTNTMKVLSRDLNDPLDTILHGSGGINIIDLANVYSCSFIATEDIGIVNTNGTFEILGRIDHSALRGCSLMTA